LRSITLINLFTKFTLYDFKMIYSTNYTSKIRIRKINFKLNKIIILIEGHIITNNLAWKILTNLLNILYASIVMKKMKISY